MAKKIERVAVIGAGTMGLGIAQVVAMAGYKVQLFDTKRYIIENALVQIERNLEKGVAKGKITADLKELTQGNIAVTDSLHGIEADLVIEAIIEDLTLKQNLYSELEDIVATDAILCTNTSSIPVSNIAAGLKYPERLVGMHFFNPAHIMRLVEVISTGFAKKETVDQAIAFVGSLGKEAVMAKDSPGFIVNRVARHFYVESLKILEEGVANHEEIDRLVEATGFKMGPFRLMDLIGVDTNFAVTTTMYNGFHQDPKFRPSRIQEQLVFSGYHGRKSGRGFYTYE
jgi:3-hydroxybutyryl-CoA dehydrogenase